jgi:predicted Zn-dependent protease
VVAIGALGLAAAAVPPWLAARAATRAARAATPQAAVAAARDAERLDDQLLGPLLVEADARLRLGDAGGARRALARAAALEPASYEVPQALARVEETAGDRAAAIAALRRANLLSGGLPETRRALQAALAGGG